MTPTFVHCHLHSEFSLTDSTIRLPELVAPGGRVLLCLNAREIGTPFLTEQMATLAPELVFEQRLPNPVPFVDVDPERALKVLVYQAASDVVQAGASGSAA